MTLTPTNLAQISQADDDQLKPSHQKILTKTGSERRRFREFAKNYFFGATITSVKSPNKFDISKIISNSKNSIFVLENQCSLNLECNQQNEIISNENNQSGHKDLTKFVTLISPSDLSNLELNSSAKIIENTSSFDIESEYFCKRKVLVIRNIPMQINIDSILQAVCCGPIEKVVQIFSNESNKFIKYLELHFIKNEHAELFYQYAKTGNFLINGQFLNCQWGNKLINEMSIKNFELINKLVFPENEQVYSQHGGSTIRTGARRCLILKKNCVEPKKYYSNNLNFYHLYSPNLADFSFKEIIADFKVFGEIINVTPVVSRKLCISINYYDIRSAIYAKSSFENPFSKTYKKYASDWVIWYGKEVNDKPCILK
ncbi:hypothetical protein QEN19_001406 [Hanseniaspora menglaensis]